MVYVTGGSIAGTDWTQRVFRCVGEGACTTY
jgi:hypothetical protein